MSLLFNGVEQNPARHGFSPLCSDDNDLPAQKCQESSNQERVFKTMNEMARVLPQFLTLYKPLGRIAALGLGATRTIYALNDLKDAFSKNGNEGQPIPATLFINALVETVALAGTLFAHPVGMFVVAAKDLVCETNYLIDHLQQGRHTEAMECGAKVLNQALYLALFTSGGLGVTVASLAVQVSLGIYQARQSYVQGSYIEAAGHVCMTLIKGKQLSSAAGQLLIVQKQKDNDTIEKLPSDPAPGEKVAPSDPARGPFSCGLRPDLAQYKEADYLNAVKVERGISLEQAQTIANSDPSIAYFSYVKGRRMILETRNSSQQDPLGLLSPLSNGYSARIFNQGDAVFFTDINKMWLGSAQGLADVYVNQV